MSDSLRARSDPSAGWDRARRAYVAILGDDDPAAAAIADGLLDRRLGFDPGEGPGDDGRRAMVVSGPDDFRELREIVESALGIGTWPGSPEIRGTAIGARIEIERPAALLGLLLAMEGLIETRSPWGRWRTVVETMAARVAEIDAITVDLRLVE